MIGRRRLRDELRRLSNSPVPVLDPVRAEQLERRVLGAVRPRELELVDSETTIPRPTGRRLAAVATLAAACALAVVVIASLDGAGPTDRILFTSGDVEVVLPDGSAVDQSGRMVVPDGSIVRLGRNGRAEFDGVTVAGAGDYLVTRDGLTLMTAPDRPGSSPNPTPNPTPPPTTGREASPTSVAEGPAVVSRPRSSEPDPATTVGRPTTTVPGRTTTTVRGATPTVVRPSSTAHREVPPPPPPDTLEPRQARPESPTTSSAPATIPPPTSSEPSRQGPDRRGP